jgi:phosphohistidine phosphatase
MNLYIVRHAWAFDRDDSQWPDDDLRPLTKGGKERFANVAATLIERGMTPEIIATSPLVRCVETAHILAAERVDVVEMDQLRPGANADDLLAWTVRQARKLEEIAWVGHSPDVDRLAAALLGQRGDSIRFAKGAVASIRFDGHPMFGAGELQWLVTAKMLGC